MRVLLQDLRTSEFLCPTGRTRSLSEAYDFRSTLEALHFAQKQGRSGIQIVMKFDRAEFDISLPVEAQFQDAALRRAVDRSRP